MSTGSELIPIALAAWIVAALARRTTVANKQVWSIETPIRDESLLAATLAALGSDHGRDGPLRYGTAAGRAVAFSWSQAGNAVAHVEGDVAEPDALRLVAAIESEYRRRVQEQVLATLLERAPGERFHAVVQRRDPDGTVVVRLQAETPGQSVELDLLANGTVKAETRGIKGDACLPYGQLVEQLTDSETIRSWYTAEYRQHAGEVSWRALAVESELE
jgi:hypothetical protein